MPDELRQKILQKLYDGRDDEALALEGEDLARLFGKSWQVIKPDVDALQNAGLIGIKNITRSNRIFRFYAITPEGIKAVEHPDPSGLKPIRVFISSPGDVEKERDTAEEVVQRLNKLSSIASRFVLRALRYEDLVPPEVGEGPQPTVNRYMREAANADIFICIFCQRMGTEVLDEATGEHYQSGTEYEFLSAYRSRQRRGKPHMLLYRKMKRVSANLDLNQLDRVNAFFKKFVGIDAEFKGLYRPFRTTKEFDTHLFHDLDTLIAKNFLPQNLMTEGEG